MTEIMIEALLYAVIGTISVLATTFFTLVLLDWRNDQRKITKENYYE